MKKRYLIIFITVFVLFPKVFSQQIKNEEGYRQIDLKGVVVDKKKQLALPYVNIIILKHNKGTITNEKGAFLLATLGLKETDTIRFQYIGYKTLHISVSQLLKSSEVILEEDVFNINEVFIVSNMPKPEDIVKGVLKNRKKNYIIEPRKEQTFLRQRFIADLEVFDIEYKKSSIEDLNEEMLNKFQEKVPKHTTSYSDFLGFIYSNIDEDREKKIKIDPIKRVNLKSKEIAEMKQFESVFEDLLNETTDKEYWKVKSGVFGHKIDRAQESEKDTLPNKEKVRYHNSTSTKNTSNLERFRDSVHDLSKYSTFEDKGLWEFLHKTNSYTYNFEGGTTMNGEDVYIIDFVPKRKGVFEGRLYISIETLALIRADYKFAPNKKGASFRLLGFSQAQIHFNGSVYFEKKEGNYMLKYFSYRSIDVFGLKRKLALQKKKVSVL